MRGRRGRIDRRWAVAASVAAHLAAFLAMFWHFGTPPRYAEPPIMSVELLRPGKPAPPQQPERAAKRTSAPASLDRRRPTLAIPPPPFTAPALPEPPSGDETREGVRATLKGLLGCDHAVLIGLSPAERQDCLDRLAQARTAELGKVPAALSLTRPGDFAAKNPTPYLIRRPKDGCKARAAGDVRPGPAFAGGGKEGFAGGVDCAWSF